MADDKKEAWEITHKVGIKVLSDVQLENVLPTYENLFRKFDTCREVARRELKTSGRYYQYNLMYDNIFSILGPRGTGKTSVAFTLEKKIKDRYENEYHDVVLPLIIPDAIPKNCSILGWLLAVVKDQIEGLEAKVKDKSDNTSSFWDSCRNYENPNPLQDKLERITQLFHAGSYNPSNEISYYKAVDNSMVQDEDYYQFAKSIADLWDLWVQRIRDIYHIEKEKCPMIYFIFDDVDLAPDRIEQLLSVMIKYLSHPNIIVLTTADEDLFLEVIENHLDRNIGSVPKEWRKYLLSNPRPLFGWEDNDDNEEEKKDNGELVNRTAKMYLGKVLPTSTRYYLRTFHTAKQKELFCLEDNCNLGQGVHQKICELLEAMGCFTEEDFMMQNGKLINFYLKYMGNTSRQIGNVYIAFQEFISNMVSVVKADQGQNRERTINAIYQNCRYFTRVALNANHELSDAIQKVDDFLDEILLAEYNQWEIYINYTQLIDFLMLPNTGYSDKQKRIDIGLQLFSLFAFVENILLLMEKGVEGGITNREKIHVIPFMTDFIEEVAFERRHILRKKLHPDLFFMHYNDLLDRMDVITKSGMSEQKFNVEYFYNFRHDVFGEGRIQEKNLRAIYWADRQWFRSLMGMLSMVYGNAYLFDKDNMAECLVFLERKQLSECEGYIDREIRQNIVNCFQTLQLQEAWLEMKKSMEETSVNTSRENVLVNLFEEILGSIEDGIANQIQEEGDGEYYIEVSRVLAECLIRLKGEDEGKILQRSLIDLSFMQEKDRSTEGGLKNLEDYEEIRALLLDLREKIENLEIKIVECGILENTEEILIQLKRLRDRRWLDRKRKAINDLIKRLERETGEEREENGIISRGLYRDLIHELDQRVIDVKKGEGFIIDDGDERESAFSLIADIASRIKPGMRFHNREGSRNVVRMAIEILSFEQLQAMYIYQTIARRYGNNNLSSKALEKVITKNDQKDTYYYGIFQKTIENLNRPNNAEGNDMRRDIENAIQGSRQRYVERLFDEATNE